MSALTNPELVITNDLSPSISSVPMEVLALGFCRTGTQSLADGLQLLGYGPIYHMREVYKNGHDKYWIEALEAKFDGKGTPYSRKEFDQFLSSYSGVSDLPAAIFFSELMDAYPDAKIILTTREEDKWIESMKATIWQLRSDKELGKLIGRFLWGDDHESGRIFIEHNEKVKKAAAERGRDVLVYEVKQGWEPLCAFLGKAVPEEKEFPRSDDWAAYKMKSARN